MLTANNSAVKIIGRVTLRVQLQPRLPEFEQEFVITADEGIECLLGIDFLKTNKCVLNLNEEKLYSSHFKFQNRSPQRKRKVFKFLQLRYKTLIYRVKRKSNEN